VTLNLEDLFLVKIDCKSIVAFNVKATHELLGSVPAYQGPVENSKLRGGHPRNPQKQERVPTI